MERASTVRDLNMDSVPYLSVDGVWRAPARRMIKMIFGSQCVGNRLKNSRFLSDC